MAAQGETFYGMVGKSVAGAKREGERASVPPTRNSIAAAFGRLCVAPNRTAAKFVAKRPKSPSSSSRIGQRKRTRGRRGGQNGAAGLGDPRERGRSGSSGILVDQSARSGKAQAAGRCGGERVVSRAVAVSVSGRESVAKIFPPASAALAPASGICRENREP